MECPECQLMMLSEDDKDCNNHIGISNYLKYGKTWRNDFNEETG